jgi:hypothetical protein
LCYDFATSLPDRLTGKIANEEWIRILEDGRRVKFSYMDLVDEGALITAQLADNEVVYSVLLAKADKPLIREEIESHFKGELAKK